MADRPVLFRRIAEALSVPRRAPAHAVSLPVLGETGSINPRPWLPRVGETVAEWVEQFARSAAELRAEFVTVDSPAAATAKLCELAESESWPCVATHRGALTDAIVGPMDVEKRIVEDGIAPAELERCPVGITACDALIAQTGSVLLTSRSAGGRGLSVYPPHHVVLASAEQLVPDLPAAYDLLYDRYAGDYPSMMSLITGPSRTGDIERVIVLGAHGPKRLTILLIG